MQPGTRKHFLRNFSNVGNSWLNVVTVELSDSETLTLIGFTYFLSLFLVSAD